ncbi:Ig heavy chain V region PJ14, partial [Varanus komodoensis]
MQSPNYAHFVTEYSSRELSIPVVEERSDINLVRSQEKSSVLLLCITSQKTLTESGFSLASYAVSWVRQPPGKVLKWMGFAWRTASPDYNPALQDQIHITKDNAKGQVSLQLIGLRLDDTAMYFCARGTVRKFILVAGQKPLFAPDQNRRPESLVGISSETLIESGGGVKKPGETLQLTCTASGFSLTSYDINWFHQPPGKGLQWTGVIWRGGSIFYNSALQTRLTITRDVSKNQAYLQMSDLQPNDTVVYYCAGEAQQENSLQNQDNNHFHKGRKKAL